jgi:hypothetical protein
MSIRWRHILCDPCFRLVERGREPFRFDPVNPAEICCRCGRDTPQPIYYRGLPDLFPCHGRHDRVALRPAAERPAREPQTPPSAPRSAATFKRP